MTATNHSSGESALDSCNPQQLARPHYMLRRTEWAPHITEQVKARGPQHHNGKIAMSPRPWPWPRPWPVWPGPVWPWPGPISLSGPIPKIVCITYVYPYPYPYYVYPYTYFSGPVLPKMFSNTHFSGAQRVVFSGSRFSGGFLGKRRGPAPRVAPARGPALDPWPFIWAHAPRAHGPFIWGCLALLFPIIPRCGWPIIPRCGWPELHRKLSRQWFLTLMNLEKL